MVDVQSNAEAISFFATLPVMLFLGYAMTRFRFESFMTPQTVTSPYLVMRLLTTRSWQHPRLTSMCRQVYSHCWKIVTHGCAKFE